MKNSTVTWLHEARIDLKEVNQNFSDAGSMTAGNCERLFKVFEKAIKSPIVEKYGSVPRTFQTHNLSMLCRSYGLWPILPVELTSGITEITPFYPVYLTEPAYTTLVSSSSVSDWRRRIAVATELLHHVEKNVICDTAAFGKLTF